MHVYKRWFRVQASHFNGAGTYDTWAWAKAHAMQGAYEAAYEDAVSVLRDSHGHNFGVYVEAESVGLDEGSVGGAFVLDDEALEAVVMEWNNTNLSVHSDFEAWGNRVSTELMAQVLAEKVLTRFPRVCRCTVRVSETPDIEAECTVVGEAT